MLVPAWLASMMHVPTVAKRTTEPEMVHAPLVDDPSIEKITGLPD